LNAAETACRAILAIAPNDPGAHVNLGVVYMRRKQWEAALKELQTGTKRAGHLA
jgi:Flp pilus assembly protein TadD